MEAIVFAISVATAALSVSAATPIAWFRLDETSGTSAADSSGSGNIGSYNGAPTLGQSAPRRFGAYFAGDGRYLYAPPSATLNSLGTANADFTVSFWVKPNGTTGGWRPMFHKGNIDNERGPGIWLQPATNLVHFRISTTAGGNEGSDSISVLPNAVWTHLAFVKAGNKWRCYINGVLDVETTLVGTTVGNNGPLYVGDDPWFAGCPSWMDDVRIFTTALTIAEIKALYGVVGHWKLDETAGVIAADATNAGNNGTHTNGPVIVPSGLIDGAISFDGVDDYIGVPASASLVASDAVAVSAWIQPTTSTNLDRMILNKEGEYEVALSDTGEIKWAIANTSPGWAWHQTGVFVPNNTWSHVVVSYDGAEVRTYLNGALAETYAASGVIGDAYPALNELRIGGRSSNPAGKCFGGAIDDVHVYTRGVTTAEVTALHGLIGHWKFAEGVGTAAGDSTLSANNAALSGGSTWGTECTGDKSLQTNGAGGIAQTSSTFAPPSKGTIAFWMRGAGASAVRGRLTGVGGDWEIRHEPNGVLYFDMGGSPFVGTEPFSTITPVNANGRWYHVAAVYNDADNSYSVYVDGELRTSGVSPVDLVPQASGLLSFGARTGSLEYWAGALRDFRVYNRRLAFREISELAGLAACWKFDETSGTVAADSSGSGRHAAVTGTAAWAPGKLNGSLQLNGATFASSNASGITPKNITLAAWANLTIADSGGAELISLGDYVSIRLNDAGLSRAFFYNGTTWASVSINQTFAGLGWRHFAAVFDDDNNMMKLYINGTEVASVATTASVSYSGLGSNVVVGRHGNGGTTHDFTGMIDDARVYTRALCPAQVMELVNDGGGPYQGVRILQWVETR